MLDFMAGWRFAAACRGEDSAYFFPPSHLEERAERRAREGYAKGLCAKCPVRAECLDYAMSTRESHGIWVSSCDHGLPSALVWSAYGLTGERSVFSGTIPIRFWRSRMSSRIFS